MSNLNAVIRKTCFSFIAVFALGCGRQAHEGQSKLADFVDTPFWPTTKPGDQNLSRSHSLYPYFEAARLKNLPLNYFRDLISAQSTVYLRYGEWPSCRSNGSSWTIYHPMINQPFSEWRKSDWSTFYNELFSVWYNLVFFKNATYAADRTQILTSTHDSFYRRAHPSDPRMAQEEGYSETIGSLMIYLYPQYNPVTGDNSRYYTLDNYKYNIGRTVSPVSHGDRPGYTPEAETTYMDQAEYKIIFRQLLEVEPPSN